MKRYVLWSVAILVLVVLLYFGYRAVFIRSAFKNTDNTRQAVFLSNGQVYFGKIEKNENDFLVLKDIYYLKTQDSLKTPPENGKISLIKLGEELHGPEDRMYINKDMILFYEDMKTNSKINEAIKSHLSSNN
ncbi:MAG TPA: hypothetical protein PK263_00480 [bacterium]|nr:hypothetical protein [bacterium]